MTKRRLFAHKQTLIRSSVSRRQITFEDSIALDCNEFRVSVFPGVKYDLGSGLVPQAQHDRERDDEREEKGERRKREMGREDRRKREMGRERSVE